MNDTEMIFQFTLVFIGAACLGTVFLLFRQPIILAYLGLGMLIGPFGFGLIADEPALSEIGQLGIIFLLFVEGLSLPVRKMLKLFRQSLLLTLFTSLAFAVIGAGVVWSCGFAFKESLIVGAALMFSSTLVALKLIPTTALHHQRMGAMMTSVLLLQDILAILFLVILMGHTESSPLGGFTPLLTVLILTPLTFWMVHKVIFPLFKRYDTIQEFIFILSIGWCFLISYLYHIGDASYEIGAFIAGTSLATSPVAYVIAERLKPLREFFLILFFFVVGAQFNWQMSASVFLTGLLLAAILTWVKPIIFKIGYQTSGETPAASRELGIRLGQVSEFSLLVGFSAFQAGVISQNASMLINWTVMLSFAASTIWVVRAYPTPIGGSSPLCKD